MTQSINIVLVGDYNPQVVAHIAIPKALEIAGSTLGVGIEITWLDTPDILDAPAVQLAPFDALWCVPASPYANADGVLGCIRYARETGLPFLGTCGGYQHAVLEYARTVLGYDAADNAEVNPGADLPLIAPLVCALVEQSGEIRFRKGSRTCEIYDAVEAVEGYHCSYGINREYVHIFDDSDLQFTGYDCDGDPRAFEIVNHPFFMGTAFQPERSALSGDSHPLILAFVKAAAARVRICA